MAGVNGSTHNLQAGRYLCAHIGSLCVHRDIYIASQLALASSVPLSCQNVDSYSCPIIQVAELIHVGSLIQVAILLMARDHPSGKVPCH